MKPSITQIGEEVKQKTIGASLRFACGILLFGLFVFALSILFAPLLAQTTTVLDEDDRLALVMLANFNNKARAECEALDSAKTYQTMRQRVEARLKAKHGMTVDQAVAALSQPEKSKSE